MTPAKPDAQAASDVPAPLRVSIGALFLAFMKVGLSGFGGVLPFARRMLVEETGWLNEEEFTTVLALSQFLPGPNIVNVSVIIGRRFQGWLGSIAATVGLMLMPMIIVLGLAGLYSQFAQLAPVRGAATGISAAASGLILAMALKMGRVFRRIHWQIAIAAIVFIAMGIVRVPLLWVLAFMAPVSVFIAWRRQ